MLKIIGLLFFMDSVEFMRNHD